MTNIDISIIIATYNRAEYLRGTLDSLAPAVMRYGEPVEIFVVNNRCTDVTDQVVYTFQQAHPELDVHLLHEERAGLSHARNTGLAHAHGAIFCFLDDDVYIPEQWLAELLKAFTLADNIGCIAGRIKLSFPETAKPDWIDEEYHGCYSQFELGDESRMLPRGETFYGANFVLTRHTVEVVGQWNTTLGRKGLTLLSGEEPEYAKRIWQAGFIIAYSASGFIHHRVAPERLTVRWIWRRSLWQGVTTYFSPEHHFFAYPLTRLPKLLSNLLLLPFVGLTLNKRLFLRTFFRIANALGPFYGWYLEMSKRTGSIGRKSRSIRLRDCT